MNRTPTVGDGAASSGACGPPSAWPVLRRLPWPRRFLAKAVRGPEPGAQVLEPPECGVRRTSTSSDDVDDQCGVRAVYMRCVWLNLSKLLLPQLQMLKPRPLLCAPRRHDWPDFCDNYPYVPLGVNIVQWLECEVDAVEARGQQVACRVSTRQISRCTPGCTQAAHA